MFRRELRRDGEGYAESYDEQTRADVESFVSRQGDRMAYTVVYGGAAIGFNNKSSNQDACQGATLELRYRTVPA